MTREKSHKRSHKSRRHPKNFDMCRTAPDYSVEEDRFGRLVNQEKRMVWPERQPRSKVDFEEFLSNPPDLVPLISPALSTRSDICCSISISNREICRQPDPEVEAAFIGGSTSKEAEKQVRPSSFVLYYRIEEPISDRAYLFMAYRNNQNSAFHFPLTCRKTKQEDGSVSTHWRVEYGDSDSREFPCLSALVRYYQVFSYYDIETGTIEAFPIWSGDNEDRVIVDH